MIISRRPTTIWVVGIMLLAVVLALGFTSGTQGIAGNEVDANCYANETQDPLRVSTTCLYVKADE